MSPTWTLLCLRVLGLFHAAFGEALVANKVVAKDRVKVAGLRFCTYNALLAITAFKMGNKPSSGWSMDKLPAMRKAPWEADAVGK